jgi:hypothetical protein
VSQCGTVSWKNAALFIATALAGEDVAFEEIDDGLWTLHFATLTLARYDERDRSLQPIPTRKEGPRSRQAGSASYVKNGKPDG